MRRESPGIDHSHVGYRAFTTVFFWALVCYGTFEDSVRIGGWYMSRLVGRLVAARRMH